MQQQHKQQFAQKANIFIRVLTAQEQCQILLLLQCSALAGAKQTLFATLVPRTLMATMELLHQLL